MPPKGDFARKTWNELSKGGSTAPSLESLRKMLEERREPSEMAVYSRQEVIDRVYGYFRNCICDEVTESGQQNLRWIKNPTKAGLAIALGLTTETLINYVRGRRSDNVLYENGSREHSTRIVATEDFDVLRKAYQVIEEFYEGKLTENRNPAGSIFWLLNSKNTEWSNEKIIVNTTEEQRKNEMLEAQLSDAGLIWDNELKEYVPERGRK